MREILEAKNSGESVDLRVLQLLKCVIGKN